MKANHPVTDHFTYEECVCPCCSRIKLIPAFYTHMELLEQMRQELGLPIIINSGYRCPEHNAEIEGSTNSHHMDFATDVRPDWGKGFVQKLKVMYRIALVLEFGGIGYYNTFLHLDTRQEQARWRG